MILMKSFRAWFCFLGFSSLIASAWAQAPLDIIGITDRTNFTASASFRVPAVNGYTYLVLLDGRKIPTDLTNQVTEANYHEVFVSRTNISTLAVSNRLVRFIVRAPDRGDTEDGLPAWVPYPVINSASSELADARLEIIAPPSFPVGMEIPIVAWIKNNPGAVVRANGLLTASGHPSIQLRRGVGSGFLGTTNPVGSLNYAAELPGLQTNKTIDVEAAPSWTTVSGTLSGNTIWAADSRMAVMGNINIPAGSTLTIGDGSIVRLDSLMNITNSGRIIIAGTAARPVVFTPVTRAQPWGGFFLVGDSAQIDANGAIFIAAGGRQSGFPGHRNEQPLFNILNRARVALTNCAAIYLAGQFHHSLDQSAPYASVTMVGSLIQRCTTAGEFNSCSLTFLRSALIEVPYEDPLYCADPDCDHDGFYLNTGTHELRDSLIGWLKDDCIDSGSGGGPAITTVSNCWIEAAFHEGLAWSGGGRNTRTFNTVLINNGQGLECGWSGGANTPICLGTGLLCLANAVGARYGDNYSGTGTSGLSFKDGFLTVSNSILLHNNRDVWGQVWDNTWNYRTNDMDIRNNLLTSPNPYHPANSIWNPNTDGWRLAEFMSTPPGAPVGISLATWGNQFAMSANFSGVPVGLSSFTTNFVSVDYEFETTNGTLLANGTLTLAPGETVKRIYPAGVDLQANNAVRLVLSNPTGGELTEPTSVLFQGSVPVPQVSLGLTTNRLAGYRIVEGTFVLLNRPSAQTVSVTYTYLGDGSTVASGTLLFNPLETSKQLFLTNVNPFGYSAVQLSLSSPVGATLTGIASVTYTNPPLTVAFGVATSQLDLASFTNGVPVRLSVPASSIASVDFRFEVSGSVLTNGTLSFAPGEILKALTAPTVNPQPYDLIRVTLANAVTAQLSAPSNVYFVPVVAAPPATNKVLVARGQVSVWRYRDTASAAPAGWQNLGFDDTSWPFGPAQLGFSYTDPEGDEATPIADNDQITSYFRHKFVVDDPNAFTNLSMWLLRDDGGVVHLNGKDVFRSPNLPQQPTVISYSTVTASGQNGENTIDTAILSATNLVAGTNIAAVEIHQQGATSSDVSFDFELIGNPVPPPIPPQHVYFGIFDGKLTLAWSNPSFILEEADQVTGPWGTAGSTSPVIVGFANTQKFFRLKKP